MEDFQRQSRTPSEPGASTSIWTTKETSTSDISILGSKVQIQWQSNMGQSLKMKDWSYTVLVMTKAGNFDAVSCDSIHYVGVDQSRLQCMIEVQTLKEKPFNLSMGDEILFQILGTSHGESVLTDPVISDETI